MRHQLAHFLGHEKEVVDDVFRRAVELLAECLVLRGDAHGARVQMALAHHDAAHGDERHGREPELVGSQKSSDHHVTTRLQLAVHLHANAPAQVVHDQHLLGLGEAELPWRSSVPDRTHGRGTRAAIVPRDQHEIGMPLGNPGGYRADTDLGHELDRDIGIAVGILEVEDQLRQILDGVNVMVRRRRDQADAGRRMPQPRDGLVDLVSGQLPALAGLGSLSDLDLQLVRVSEVMGGDAEPSGRDLLDLRAAIILVARRILAPLAGVGPPADAVHGLGQRFVSLRRNRTEAHRSRAESLDDFRSGFHLR